MDFNGSPDYFIRQFAKFSFHFFVFTMKSMKLLKFFVLLHYLHVLHGKYYRTKGKERDRAPTEHPSLSGILPTRICRAGVCLTFLALYFYHEEHEALEVFCLFLIAFMFFMVNITEQNFSNLVLAVLY